MERFGDQLKQAREARGESLEGIAQKTRISRRYLEALEASDLDVLPGGAFDKGYIRSYAETIGEDPGPYLEGYDAERDRRGQGEEESQARLMEDLSRLAQKRSDRSGLGIVHLKRALAFASGVLILAISAWLFARRDAAPPQEPTSAPRGEAAPRPKSRPAPDAVTAPLAPRPTPRAASLARPAEEAPGKTDADADGDIQVPDAGVGRGIVEHNLVGAGRRFAEGSTVVFWTRVVGASRGATIRHVWRHDGQIMMLSNLTIGGPHWRTFSRLVLPEGSSGGWEVEARDPDGKVLAQERFVVLSPSPETTGAAGLLDDVRLEEAHSMAGQPSSLSSTPMNESILVIESRSRIRLFKFTSFSRPSFRDSVV